MTRAELIGPWLDREVPALHKRTPATVIASAGYELVYEIAAELAAAPSPSRCPSIDAALVPVSGTWVRYRAVARRPAGNNPGPGRWQRIGTPRLYLADTEETAWAEVLPCAG